MLVIIPARLGSSRLPEKPLALIGGVPLILHCWRRAVEADVGPVWVATDSSLIGGLIADAGGNAVVTSERCATGSDRVAQASALVDPNRSHEFVINQQGDMPFVSPSIVRMVASAIESGSSDMVTAAHCGEFVDAAVFHRVAANRHIGIYGYRREALERFAALPQSPREIDERLEQLRAVEAGFSIRVVDVDTFPTEINTPADLVEARQIAGCLHAG